MTKRFLILAVLLAILVGVIVYSKWRPNPPRVSGIVEADEIRLGSRVGGRVARVLVDEGQPVTAGELLVELEPFDLLERESESQLRLAGYEAELSRMRSGHRSEEIAQAKARLDQFQARLDLLQAGPREQDIEAARGRLAVARAELTLAERVFERLSNLVRSNATSRQELDTAREGLEASSANLTVRQQELDLLLAGTRAEELREAAGRVEESRQAWQMMTNGYRREEIEKAQAARDAAQATLLAIQRQKEELGIKSPIAGVIEAIELQPGDMVAPNAPVLSMLDQNRLWIRAYIPQSRVGMKIGEEVQVTVDSFPREPFTGRISYVARQAEFTPGNVQTIEERSKQVFRIKVTIQDPHHRLRPGMMADVWLGPGGDHE